MVSVGASWFLYIFAIYSSTPVPPTVSQIPNVTPAEILSTSLSVLSMPLSALFPHEPLLTLHTLILVALCRLSQKSAEVTYWF